MPFSTLPTTSQPSPSRFCIHENWEPDAGFIDRIERLWSDSLDEVVWEIGGQSEVQTVGGMIEAFRQDGDTPELVEYLTRIFDKGRKIYEKDAYTQRDIISEMRAGTPLGILHYTVLIDHKDCCMPGEDEGHKCST